MKIIEPLNPGVQSEIEDKPSADGIDHVELFNSTINTVSSEEETNVDSTSGVNNGPTSVSPLPISPDPPSNPSIQPLNIPQKKAPTLKYIIGSVIMATALILVAFLAYRYTQHTPSEQQTTSEVNYKSYYSSCYDVKLKEKYKNVTLSRDTSCHLKVNSTLEDAMSEKLQIDIEKLSNNYVSLQSLTQLASEYGKPVKMSDTVLRVENDLEGKEYTKLYILGSNGKLGEVNKKSAISITVITYGNNNVKDSEKIASDIQSQLTAPTKNAADAAKKNEQTLSTDKIIDTPCYTFKVIPSVKIKITDELNGVARNNYECNIAVVFTKSDGETGSISVKKLLGDDGSVVVKDAYNKEKAEYLILSNTSITTDTTLKVDGLDSRYLGIKQVYGGTSYFYSSFVNLASKQYKDKQGQRITGIHIVTGETGYDQQSEKKDSFTRQLLSIWHWK